MQTITTDTALVERVQRGDHHAFAELVRRHDGGLRALATRAAPESRARRRRSPRGVPQGVPPDRHLPARRHSRHLAVPDHHNTCLDELRRRPSAVVPDAELDRPAAGRGPADRAVARMEAADVLGRLMPEVQAAVVVVHGYGYDYAGASRILGVPAGTVASRLHRARRRVEGVGAHAA